MASDPRFAKVFSDPRFIVAPKKSTKVKVDSRFKGMLKDKEFNVVAKVDKYGRKVSKKDMYATQNYRDESESENSASSSSSEEPTQKAPPKSKKTLQQEAIADKYYDVDGKFKWDGKSSVSASSSDEESEEVYSDAMSGVWSVESMPEVPVDKADDGEVLGKRLAVTNLDWDAISAFDILVLFRSFCHTVGAGAMIDKVQIYPSLYGIE